MGGVAAWHEQAYLHAWRKVSREKEKQRWKEKKKPSEEAGWDGRGYVPRSDRPQGSSQRGRSWPVQPRRASWFVS